MADPLQRALVRRRWTYMLAIIGLLTLSLIWRGKISLTSSALADRDRVTALHHARRTHDFSKVPPAPNALRAVGDWIASRTILESASRDALDLREVEQGEDTEILSSFVRLSLTGSRGVAITMLWMKAQEYQKRNEFHKFEQFANAITSLLPNFTTPWLFQSWNISYNVSVETDRLTDMYYYIARGIELLAKGERLNRNSPDMRYNIAFYYQNKFSVSDKVTTLRSMMQLSAIKPSERNPDNFRDRETRQMDAGHREAFREFVRKNPQLCRRLRDKLGYTRPEQIIRFLEDNERVPTRYDKDQRDALLPAHEQFPALPPRFVEGPDELHPGLETLDDTYDAFQAARAWFLYANTVIPPPTRDAEGPRLTPADRFRYRIPKMPTLIIFRQGAQRAQTYLAERLQKEGWFDNDTVWYPDEGADIGLERWFGDTAESTALSAGMSSREAWAKAYQMWLLHGDLNGLRYSPDTLLNLQEKARAVPDDPRLGSYSNEQLNNLGLTREQVKARDTLRAYGRNREITNYAFFLSSTEAEQDPQTVKARQKLWLAERARLAGKADPAAIRQYAEALSSWRQVLFRFKDFHYNEHAEEESYEMQLNLMFMLEKSPEILARARDMIPALQALAPAAHDELTAHSLREDIAREIAESETNLRIAAFDPQVQARVTRLIGEPLDDATLHRDWHVVLKWKRAIAAEAAARANPKPLTPAEREKKADEPEWRAKAVALMQEAGTKPLPGWPQLNEARDEIARAVVVREFDWLPEYREPFKDESNRWVRSDTAKSVKERMNLIRVKPSAEPGPEAR